MNDGSATERDGSLTAAQERDAHGFAPVRIIDFYGEMVSLEHLPDKLCKEVELCKI